MPDFFSFFADPQARRRLMADAIDEDDDADDGGTPGGLLGSASDDADTPLVLGLLSAPSAQQRLARGLLGDDDGAGLPFVMDEPQMQFTKPVRFSAPQDTSPFSQLLRQISLQDVTRDDRAADTAGDSPPTPQQSQAMFRQMERDERQATDTGATALDYRDDDNGLFGAALRAAGGDRQRALAVLDAWAGSGGFATDRNGSPVVSDGQSLPWVDTGALSADALAQAAQRGAQVLGDNGATTRSNARDESAAETRRELDRFEAMKEPPTHPFPVVPGSDLRGRREAVKKGYGSRFEIAPNSAANAAAPVGEIGFFSTVGQNKDAIEDAAQKWGVSPDLIRAVMYMEESHGYYDKPFERLGLNKSIQPMNVHRVWGDFAGTREQLLDPTFNIDVGAKILAGIQANLAPQDRTVANIATLYNKLGADKVTDYGARVNAIHEAKAWIKEPLRFDQDPSTRRVWQALPLNSLPY